MKASQRAAREHKRLVTRLACKLMKALAGQILALRLIQPNRTAEEETALLTTTTIILAAKETGSSQVVAIRKLEQDQEARTLGLSKGHCRRIPCRASKAMGMNTAEIRR